MKARLIYMAENYDSDMTVIVKLDDDSPDWVELTKEEIELVRGEIYNTNWEGAMRPVLILKDSDHTINSLLQQAKDKKAKAEAAQAVRAKAAKAAAEAKVKKQKEAEILQLQKLQQKYGVV